MTGKQPRDMPASVRARLLNIAKLNNEPFDLVLVRFAIERLLYRLSQSQYRDRFVVKGATMFQIWSNLSHRPTRDLDLLGTGEPDVDRFVEIFRDLCVQEVENDGLEPSGRSPCRSVDWSRVVNQQRVSFWHVQW